MVLPICSFSRAACRTAAFSFTKHNVRTALNGQYKRTFSSSPPPKVGVEKVVRVIRKGTADGKGAATAETGTQTWLQRFLAHKEIPPRSTFAWYREMLLISTVFGITGTSTMVLVSGWFGCQCQRACSVRRQMNLGAILFFEILYFLTFRSFGFDRSALL
jgi:hypothetical protein